MAVTLRSAQQPTRDVIGTRPLGLDRPVASLLGAVLAVALVLRLWSLSWGLPWAFHPDEIYYVDKAEDMVRAGDLNPRYFQNPTLLTYFVAAELLGTRLLGPLAGPLTPDVPGSANLLARLDSALIGTASVGLVFAIGQVLFNRRVGLLGAVLLAVSFLHVRDSHYGVNDVPATGLLLASLYFSCRLLRQPAWRWYLLAGLAGGLATSTKYSMGFFFVPILAAHWLAKRTTDHGRRTADNLSSIVLAAGAGLAAYLAGTPYTVLDFDRFWSDFATQSGYGSNRWLGQPADPVPLLYVTNLLQGFGPLSLALALLGLLVVWRAQRVEAAVLCAFPAAYLLFLTPKSVFFARLVVPLLPFLSLLAGIGVLALLARLLPSWRPIGLAAILAAAIGQPLAFDIMHNRILMQSDTRILANEWVQANLPAGSRLRVEGRSLLDQSERYRTYTPNTAGLRIEQFLSAPEIDQLRIFVDRNVQYVVTSNFAYDRYQGNDPRRPDAGQRYQRFNRDLEEQTELVARFAPGVGGRDVPYSQDIVFTPLWDLEQYERPGPTIRIYSLAPLGAGAPDPAR